MRTTTLIRLIAAALVLPWFCQTAAGARTQEATAETPALHDPLLQLERETDDLGRSVFAAFLEYDAATLKDALGRIEARLDTDEALESDRYLLAQGYVYLLTIHKFYQQTRPDDPPEAHRDLDPAAVSDQAQEFAKTFAETHPKHSDIHRVEGELISFQIQGMVGGMTKGPLARAAVDRARELDPQNGWALFSQARMHFHNPAFVGGDKELALKEFRQVARSLNRFRVQLYLARAYHAQEMPAQARFWTKKALKTAPGNPEALLFSEQLAESEQERP